MDQFSVYVPKLLPKQERFVSGRRSCKGCGKALSARLASKAIAENSAFPDGVLAGSSASVSPLSTYSYTHDDVSTENIIESLLEQVEAVNRASSEAAKSAHRLIKKAVVGVDRRVFMSDTLALTRALQNEQHALYLCFDNDVHVDSLIRRAIPQPFNLNENPPTVSAAGMAEAVREKNMPSIMDEADFAYFATACPSEPFDLITKVKKGLACAGNAFILVLTPCPTGWIFPPGQSGKVGMLAVQTGYFPLYEIERNRTRITRRLSTFRPLQEFLAVQKRFLTFPPLLIPAMQKAIEEFYKNLSDTPSLSKPARSVRKK